MKKKIFGILILLMTMVSCAGIFSACGASRQDLKLESETQSIELVLGDTARESTTVEVNVAGFGDGISGIMGFEVVGECARVESISTSANSGKSSCVLRAIRSGSSTLRATLFDGGASLEIPIYVEQKVVSMTAKTNVEPFAVKGGGKVVFDAEKLINFNPISTTQRGVYFIVGDEISDGFEAAADDERSRVEVVAINTADENVRTKFHLKLIDPIAVESTKVDGNEGNNVVLAVNSATKNTAHVEVVLTSKEEQLVCLNGFHSGKDFTIRTEEQTHVGNTHTFKFAISGLAGGQVGSYDFKFGVGEQYDYFVTSQVNISTVVVAKNIAIGLETSNYSTLRVFNSKAASSKGTSFTFSILPSNVNNLQRSGEIAFDPNAVEIYNSAYKKLKTGDTVQSDSTLFVVGKSGVTGETKISFKISGMEGLSDDVLAEIPVEIVTGATKIIGQDSIVLKLASDGSASVENATYRFDVDPENAYVDDILVEAKSTIIAVQKVKNENAIQIQANSSGKTKIILMLGNGITKEVAVEVICEMDENSLVLDAPNSTQNEFVGEKTPVVVSHDKPLQKIVIQKSRAYEKAVPLNFSFSPQNASNVKYSYSTTKISGEKENVVEIVGNSLVGKNEGTARVDVVVSYDKFDKGQKVVGTQSFSFEVEVYVAVSSFYFSDSTIKVADKNSVGFFKPGESQKYVTPYFSPLDATNQTIEYTMSGQNETKTSGILKNDYISFNIDTGEIVGNLASGITPETTTITARLVDFQREFVTTINVDVQQYELVRNIVVDNVQDDTITLSATNSEFQILAHAEKVTASNKTLVYSFVPDDEKFVDVVSVDQSGRVRLDTDKLKGGTKISGFVGKIKVSAQDSFKDDNRDAETYRNINVIVANGTQENPYPISTAQELLALGKEDDNQAPLAQHYQIVGVIDLKNEPISPLGVLSGSIVGTQGSKIVGINITQDNGSEENPCAGLFSEIAKGAYIKNVAFSGSINYEGGAQNVGLVAGVNHGTIENCSINITSSQVTLTNNAFVGGMFGVNAGTISTTIKSGTQNHNLAIYDGQLCVSAQGGAEVYVGGIVGKNSKLENSGSATIRRYINGVSLYGTSGYSANVDIKTINAYATGAIAGLNEGSLLSLSSCGKIVGGNRVGGFVGVQSSGSDVEIGLYEETGNEARSFSNTFVQGNESVGGFVGRTEGGTISKCGVEIYRRSNYLEHEKYIALATGNVGGFVGSAEGGRISQCYVESFRGEGSNNLVRMSAVSSVSNPQVGTFVGYLSGATIEGCYSNVETTKLGSHGGTNGTNYNNEADKNALINAEIMPKNPEEVGLKVLKNEMKTEGEFNLFKVVYLNHFKAQKQDEQAAIDSLNKVELGSIISHELGDAGADVSSSDSSIIKVESDGLKVMSCGLCKLTISSRFNSSLKEIAYIFVVAANEGMELSQSVGGIDYSIADDSTLIINAGQVSSIDKHATNAVLDGVATVEGGNYDILVDSDKFGVVNYENLFTIGVTDDHLKAIKDNAVTDFVERVNLDAFYAVEIEGKRFVSSAFATKQLSIRIVAGITDFRLSSSTFEMCANDQLRIGFDFDSALGENEELYVCADKIAYINGKRVGSGAYEKIKAAEDKTTSGEFLIELYNKNYQGVLRLVFVDKNKTFQKQIIINVLPQSTEFVATRYYDGLPSEINLASTTSLMTPGKVGLLLLDILPSISDVEYVTITNAPTNPYDIKFDLVNSNYYKISGVSLFESGIKIPRKLIMGERQFQTIFIKTFVSVYVSDNQPLSVIVGTSDGYRKEIVLTTKHVEKVEGSIENKIISDTGVPLANGLDYTLNINSVGFSADQIQIKASSEVVSISKISDFVYNIHANNVVDNSSATITIYGEKEVNGMKVKTPDQTINVVVKDYVVHKKVNFEGASEQSFGGEYDIVLGYVGVKKELRISLINGVNCEYDISNERIVQKLRLFEKELNENAKFSYVVDGSDFDVVGGEESDEFIFNSETAVYPKKAMTAQDSKTTFMFVATIDSVNYTATMKMNVDNISSSSSMIPVETAEDFMNMTSGNFYILANDITLSAGTFKPITAAIAGFDGNNKKITITGFQSKNDDQNDENAKDDVNFGLFEEIRESVIVQNVHVYFENFTSTIVSESLNFGFIAAINSGVITNCFVEGDSAKIVVNENASNSSANRVGAIVAENNGFITNSRVEISIYSAYGNVAGIAAANSGIISSCYVKNTTIINNSGLSDVMTAGIVCENSSSARIFGCFIEGGEFEDGKIYCDDSVSIRANSKVAAFVFQNAGEVQDSYANIYVCSGSDASGFVYENSQTGSIMNSFSLCLLQKNTDNNYAFVALDATGIVNTTAGKFESCYFCGEINAWQKDVSSQTSVGIVCFEKMDDFGKAEKFDTFGLSSNLAPEKGVWALKSVSYEPYLYPRLISAENIISTSKSLIEKVVDVSNGAVTYIYRDMPDGSKYNPFIIATAEDLENSILSTVQNDMTSSAYIRLVANVDYSDEKHGVEQSNLHKVRYCGEFDGNGLKITGLNLNSQSKVDSAGLFSAIGTNTKVGVVKNLILIPEQINFPNASKVGALAGTVMGSGVYNVSIQTSNVANPIVMKGQNFVGGLVGYVFNSAVFNSQIINCDAELNVNATALNQTSEEGKKGTTAIYLPSQSVVNINLAAIAGGVVGHLKGGTMAYCRSSAPFVIGQIAGGLVGYLGTGAKIKNSSMFVSNNSSIRSSFVAGGLVGINFGSITQSTVVGNANAYFQNASIAPVAVGGVVGINVGDLIFSQDTRAAISLDIDNIDIGIVGGLVGIMRSGKIMNYAVESNLRGKLNVGGVVGEVQSGSGKVEISSCVVGKISTSESSGDNTTRIQAYGFEANTVGVIVGKKASRSVHVGTKNVCSKNVLFTRQWVFGGSDDSVFDKSFEKVEKDNLGSMILLDYAEPESNE